MIATPVSPSEPEESDHCRKNDRRQLVEEQRHQLHSRLVVRKVLQGIALLDQHNSARRIWVVHGRRAYFASFRLQRRQLDAVCGEDVAAAFPRRSPMQSVSSRWGSPVPARLQLINLTVISFCTKQLSMSLSSKCFRTP